MPEHLNAVVMRDLKGLRTDSLALRLANTSVILVGFAETPNPGLSAFGVCSE
jgi:hypothetical protein